MKRTPWFPVSIKPVHIGRYEVQGKEHWNCKSFLRGGPLRYWDGEMWRAWEGGPQSVFGGHHSHQWRGLAERAAAQGAARQDGAA